MLEKQQAAVEAPQLKIKSFSSGTDAGKQLSETIHHH